MYNILETEKWHYYHLQAGLRTLHEAGPELQRTISGNLEELLNDDPEPMHRVINPPHYSLNINFTIIFFAHEPIE